MPSKRKREIEDFDPNKSDSDDENFEPGADAPAVRSKKRSRGPKIQRSAGGRRRANRYNGSDIEDDDDEDVSDSQDEGSFVSEEEEDEEVNAPVNAAGRRARKAATKHNSYKESDDEESEDAEESDDVLSEDLPKPKKKDSLLIKLKVPKTASTPAPAAPATRRSTRARTEELGEEHVELTNSGKHSRPASRSRSPEAFARTRSSRSIKGLKKGPETIEEATQESSGPA
ncbi:ATPase [Colletotrichum higginsianum]|nr:ATPase [Colletotrichum higginsianum]